MSDEHAYNGNLEYAKNLTIRLGKLFGIFGLALYALESVAFTLRRFSELLSFEKRGLADIAAALGHLRLKILEALRNLVQFVQGGFIAHIYILEFGAFYSLHGADAGRRTLSTFVCVRIVSRHFVLDL